MHHDGFDWEGIQKAMEKNQRRGRSSPAARRFRQQLAKNLFLPDKTPWRKGQEVVTLMIETFWSKRRILEVHASTSSNGASASSARRRRHGTITEQRGAPVGRSGGRLAGMVPSPRFYDRNRNAPGLGKRARGCDWQRMAASHSLIHSAESGPGGGRLRATVLESTPVSSASIQGRPCPMSEEKQPRITWPPCASLLASTNWSRISFIARTCRATIRRGRRVPTST